MLLIDYLGEFNRSAISVIVQMRQSVTGVEKSGERHFIIVEKIFGADASKFPEVSDKVGLIVIVAVVGDLGEFSWFSVKQHF